MGDHVMLGRRIVFLIMVRRIDRRILCVRDKRRYSVCICVLPAAVCFAVLPS